MRKQITISNTQSLISMLADLKAKGQFATIYGCNEFKLNKFPTDGSERVRIADDFHPYIHFSVTYHFGEDYEKAMERAIGEPYKKGADTNRETIVKNLAMRYISTDNTCLIYLISDFREEGYTLNGEPLTDEERAYMDRYTSTAAKKECAVQYRTLSVRNVKRIVANGTEYLIDIKESSGKVA